MFHVVNRGLARRKIMENNREHRFFLSLLAHGARRGWIAVHAYSLLDNHYHLLLGSMGHLSRFMCWAGSRYVREFNRPRERDGPLFRGRFRARRITGEDDFRNVVRYIDGNAVVAGLVARPADHEFGSARHYATSGPRPRWLHRKEVELLVTRSWELPYDPQAYAAVFAPGSESLRWCVDRRIGFPTAPVPPALPRAESPEQLREWLRREASADGFARKAPLVAPDSVLRGVAACRAAEPAPWSTGRTDDPWLVLTVGLLRATCGLTYDELATLCRLSASGARRHCQRHCDLVSADPQYAARATEALACTLAN